MDTPQPQKHHAKTPLGHSGAKKSSILQTAQAFKSIIDSGSADDTQDGEGRNQFSVLIALVHVRRSLRELVEKTRFRKVELLLVEDDAFGWPRMRVQAKTGQASICELSVGGQTRREGAIIYFRESDRNTRVELTEVQLQDRDFTDKALRTLVRTFFESVKRIVTEKESIEKKVANVLQVLSDEGLESHVAEHNTASVEKELALSDLFNDSASEKKKDTEAENPLDDIDFF